MRQPQAVLFGAIPLFFAIHQFTEGFVWLGADHLIRPEAKSHVAFLFILYAQGILPFIMPLSVLLIEPPGWRRYAVLGLTALGAILCGYVVYALIAFHSEAVVQHHSLEYRNPATDRVWIAIAYVVATCGALLVSSQQVVRWFGLLNLIGVVLTLIIKAYAFTSIWCLYAAIVSTILYWQFSRGHIRLPHLRETRSVPV